MNARLKGILQKRDELELSVRGRRSKREIPRPVWFVVRGDSLLFLPVAGRATQWYKNLRSNPEVKLKIGSEVYASKVKVLAEEGAVREVVELFTEKYGREDMKRYYSAFDVAVQAELK